MQPNLSQAQQQMAQVAGQRPQLPRVMQPHVQQIPIRPHRRKLPTKTMIGSGPLTNGPALHSPKTTLSKVGNWLDTLKQRSGQWGQQFGEKATQFGTQLGVSAKDTLRKGLGKIQHLDPTLQAALIGGGLAGTAGLLGGGLGGVVNPGYSEETDEEGRIRRRPRSRLGMGLLRGLQGGLEGAVTGGIGGAALQELLHRRVLQEVSRRLPFGSPQLQQLSNQRRMTSQGLTDKMLQNQGWFLPAHEVQRRFGQPLPSPLKSFFEGQ